MAELINEQDSLNKGRVKINESILASERAEQNSTEAVNTANEAKVQSENTQTQLDTIVINGDSSVEAAQARVDENGTAFTTLKDRLDAKDRDFTSQVEYLEQNKAEQSELNITNKEISYQPSITNLLNDTMRKARYNETFTIVCMGDSLTYGYDITSTDRRPPDPNPTPNGSVHSRERASITYPEALQNYLNIVYPNKVTVLNRGFSGDTTETSYPRWDTNPDSDVTLIMLGTNDSSKDVGIDNFLVWYRKIIKREIDWGSAVILLTPPRRRGDDNRIDVYGNAVYQLGEEFGCPIVDMAELTANMRANTFSDQTHFNGKGYDYIGARLASLFIGKGIVNPMNVDSGRVLSAREYADSVKFISNASIVTSTGYPTPDETTLNSGIAAYLSASGKLIYSFYTEVDDLLIYPSLYFASDSPVKFSLDFATDSQAVPNTYMYDQVSASYERSVPTEVTFQKSDCNWRTQRDVFYINGVTSLEEKKIHVPKRGWHTLLIEGDDVRIHGLDFISYREMRNMITTNGLNHSVQLTLQNGWENYGSSPLTFSKYGKIGILQGWITKTTLDTAVITKLPVNVLYPQNHFISVGGTAANQNTLPVLRIQPNGDVSLVNSGDVTLNRLVINIVFPVE